MNIHIKSFTINKWVAQKEYTDRKCFQYDDSLHSHYKNESKFCIIPNSCQYFLTASTYLGPFSVYDVFCESYDSTSYSLFEKSLLKNSQDVKLGEAAGQQLVYSPGSVFATIVVQMCCTWFWVVQRSLSCWTIEASPNNLKPQWTKHIWIF